MTATDQAAARLIAELRSIVDRTTGVDAGHSGADSASPADHTVRQAEIMLESIAFRPDMRALVWGTQSGVLAQALRAFGLSRIDVASADMPPADATAYDLVLLNEPAGDSVDRAVAALDQGGLLLVVLNNERSLSALLRTAATSAPPASQGGAERVAAVRAALSTLGLDHQAVRLLYGDSHSACLVADERLADDPDLSGGLTMLVHEPLADEATGTLFVSEPRDGFLRLFSDGRGSVAADWILLAAAREAAVLADLVRPEGLLLTAYPARQRTWRAVRAVEPHEDRWRLRAMSGAEAHSSGPLSIRPTTSDLLIGADGETVLSETIARSGLRSETTERLVAKWWDAALSAYQGSPSDARQFDVLPRYFSVTEDGMWHFTTQPTTFRFPLPPVVVATRALHHLLVDRSLRWRWIPGTHANSTLHEILTSLLEIVGLRFDDAARYLWLEVESDLLVRTGVSNDDHRVTEERLHQALDAPLAAGLWALPLAQQVHAAIETAAHQQRAPLLVELEDLRDVSEARISELERSLSQAADQTQRTEAQEAELARQRQQIERLSQDVEQRTKEALEARLAVERQDLRLIGLDDAVAERGRDLDAMRTQLREQETLASETQRRLAALQYQLDEALERIVTMRRSLRIREGQNKALQLAVESFDRPVVALKRRLRGPRGGIVDRNEIDSSSLFDAAWYSARYPDVAEIRMDPAMHYLVVGATLGYDPSTRFSTHAYLEANPDVAEKGPNALLHYLRFGAAEGRLAPAPTEPGHPEVGV